LWQDQEDKKNRIDLLYPRHALLQFLLVLRRQVETPPEQMQQGVLHYLGWCTVTCLQ
jgi:hypothetical protein